jgi:hypothetical protein
LTGLIGEDENEDEDDDEEDESETESDRHRLPCAVISGLGSSIVVTSDSIVGSVGVVVGPNIPSDHFPFHQ